MQYTNILLPSKFNVLSEDATTGVFDIEGLYPGYGHTLGNSLRRVILSSLSGSAVTLIKIEGADHEYATLAGVKEDVLAILLNLKQVRFRSLSDEPQLIKLVVKGAQIVTAKNIDGAGTVEILNPDQYIAEITTKTAELSIELTINRGVGFVPREMLFKEKMPIGTIAVDAIFTPIRKVSYEVENMRVGDRTDHNRLRITIQTDGTVSPREAFEQAIKIVVNQLRAIINLTEEEMMPTNAHLASFGGDTSAFMGKDKNIASFDMQADTTAESDEDNGVSDILKTRIESLELSTRTFNALSEASIRTIGGLVKKTGDDLLALDGIGAKGIEEISDALAGLGVSLKTS